MIKATFSIEKGLRVINQTSLLGVHSISELTITDMIVNSPQCVTESGGTTGPILSVDQSKVAASITWVENYCISESPLIEVQSDS